MVTVRDVAREAGVSSATVSRALTGSGAVSADTRHRVMLVAKQLGYRGNAVAKSLRVRQTESIGILLPDIRNPFFTELAYYAEKAAAANHLSVMMGSADEQADQQDRYLDALSRHQVDGIIAVPQGEPSDTLRTVAESVPTVFLDRDPGIVGVPTITSDNQAGMASLVDHVMSLGHRRIAVVAGPQSTSTGRVRLEALRERLAFHGVELGGSDVEEGDFRLDSGVRATEELLDAGNYDVVIAADNLMALGALQVLRQRRLRVGEDIGLACVDDLDWFSLLDPPVTVVAQDPAVLAAAAVDTLLRRIQGEPADSVVVPMQLIARASCGEPGADQGASLTGRDQEVPRG